MNPKLLMIAVVLLAASAVAAQDRGLASSQLVDSFGKANSEERSAKFDAFFLQLLNLPDSKGFVFVYCGKSCRYGEIESHFRGIELKINGMKFDRSRITVVHGGCRDGQEVELWMQASGASAPAPNPTLSIKNVTFTKVTTHNIEPIDCCGSQESQWKTFRSSK